MKSELQVAMEVLVKHLKEDEGYRHSWVANIAVAFQDEFELERKKKGDLRYDDIHAISNKAADKFITLLTR